jgi:hypothetical protein
VKRNMEDKVSLKRSILDIPLIEGEFTPPVPAGLVAPQVNAA